MAGGYTFLDIGPNNITPRLRCPRCQAPAKVMVYCESDGNPTLRAICSSLGTACGQKKLTDFPLVFEAGRVQLDINIREIVRRFSHALKAIASLEEGTGDSIERLAGAINVAKTALSGVVPVENGPSIGPPAETDAATDIVRGLAAGKKPMEGTVEHRTPGGIVIPAPGTYPRSCRDCGVQVMAHKETNPVRCAACAQRHRNNEIAKQMLENPKRPTGDLEHPQDPPAGNEERTCIVCGVPVIMAIGSDETPVCAVCSEKPDESSDERPALSGTETPTPVGGTALKLPERPSQLAGEQPAYKLYGYSDEDTYYKTEWGGADCPACGKTLDETGRKHADGTKCEDAAS